MSLWAVLSLQRLFLQERHQWTFTETKRPSHSRAVSNAQTASFGSCWQSVIPWGAEFSAKHSSLEGRHPRLSPPPATDQARSLVTTMHFVSLLPLPDSFHMNRYVVSQKVLFSASGSQHSQLWTGKTRKSYELSSLYREQNLTESKLGQTVIHTPPQTIKLWIEQSPPSFLMNQTQTQRVLASWEVLMGGWLTPDINYSIS